MLKKVLIFLTLIIVLVYLMVEVFVYLYNQHIIDNNKYNAVYKTRLSSFDYIAPCLLIYKAKKNNEKIYLAKLTNNNVWHPFLNFQTSSFLINYFELFENIEQNNFIYYNIRAKQEFGLEVHNFSNMIQNKNEIVDVEFFNLIKNISSKNKKMILQLNLKSLNSSFIENILDYSDNINGLIIFLDTSNRNELCRSKFALEKINEKYILVARNFAFDENLMKNVKTIYYKGIVYDSPLILSYINKLNLDEYSISLDQNTEHIYSGDLVKGYRPLKPTPQSDIHWVVICIEKIKELWNKMFANKV